MELLSQSGHLKGRFLTTRWSWVDAACDLASPESLPALERLCQAYWPSLYAFALRRGRDPHLAQDLTQAFFARFIERGYLRAADRERGRFRTFLLTSFEHFLIHEWEKRRAAKRGGQYELLSWDDHRDALEARVASTAADVSAQTVYDREWALSIMERALAALREDCQRLGQEKVFEVLGRYLHAEAVPGEYPRAAAELGLPERAVRLAVHRLRRRYGRLVRDAVRETVASEADLGDEMRYLVELISS